MSRPDHLEEFEANFGPLLQGTIDALTLEESSKDDSEDGPKPTGLEEIRKIYQAEEKLKECRKVSREMVDAARNDLRGWFFPSLPVVYTTSKGPCNFCFPSVNQQQSQEHMNNNGYPQRGLLVFPPQQIMKLEWQRVISTDWQR